MARDGAAAGRGGWPDRNTEYLLYQTLVGAWPLTAERAAGVPGEGDPGGEGAHVVDRPRPGLRRRAATRSSRASSPTRRSSTTSTRSSRRSSSRAGSTPLAQTLLQADVAGRARHLPGHRAVGPQPGRPRQPPPGRLRPAPALLAGRGSTGPTPRAAAGDPGRRRAAQAAGDAPGAGRSAAGARRASAPARPALPAAAGRRARRRPRRRLRPGRSDDRGRRGGRAPPGAAASPPAAVGPTPRSTLPAGRWTDVLTGASRPVGRWRRPGRPVAGRAARPLPGRPPGATP